MRKIEETNLKAAQNYRPSTYPGRVDFFRAEIQKRGAYPDPNVGWDGVEIGEFVVHDIKGHHGNLLFEPQVSDVAAILSDLLEELN